MEQVDEKTHTHILHKKEDALNRIRNKKQILLWGRTKNDETSLRSINSLKEWEYLDSPHDLRCIYNSKSSSVHTCSIYRVVGTAPPCFPRLLHNSSLGFCREARLRKSVKYPTSFPMTSIFSFASSSSFNLYGIRRGSTTSYKKDVIEEPCARRQRDIQRVIKKPAVHKGVRDSEKKRLKVSDRVSNKHTSILILCLIVSKIRERGKIQHHVILHRTPPPLLPAASPRQYPHMYISC